MALKQLDKHEWQAYCAMLSNALSGTRAEIEVASLELGAQIEAEWLPFVGIVYDPKDDIMEIAVENIDHTNVDHIIHKPREVHVDYGIGGLTSIQVIDGEDVRHIVQLRYPLALPSPAQQAEAQGM